MLSLYNYFEEQMIKKEHKVCRDC